MYICFSMFYSQLLKYRQKTVIYNHTAELLNVIFKQYKSHEEHPESLNKTHNKSCNKR